MKSQLNEEEKSIIHNLRVKSGEALRAGKFDESIALSLEAWQKLPEPKFPYAESYLIITGLIFIYSKAGDFANAELWCEKLYDPRLGRFEDGDKEYLSAKVAFEAGKKEKAMELFRIADTKSEGRCWTYEDKAYKKFFKDNK